MSKYTLDRTKQVKLLLSQIKALQDVIQEILNNQNSAEHSRYVSYRDMAYVYNEISSQAQEKLGLENFNSTFNVKDMKGPNDTLWGYQKRVLEQVLLSSKLLYASLESEVDFVDDEFDNLENFLESKLRTVIFERPQKEVEVQNAIESLLLGRGLSKGNDYDRETGKFEFSGKEFIPDFVIPKLNLCIEVKLLREGKKSKIIEEISADITAYSKEYTRQLYVVYDLGWIQNKEEFKRDIENVKGVKIKIIKH